MERTKREYVLWRLHRSGLSGVEAIQRGETANSMIEKIQRNEKRLGYPTGIDWQAYEGNIVGGLVQLARLGW